MLQEMKSGTVKVALMLTLAAAAFAVGNAQAQQINIPVGTGDSEIQNVVSAVRGDSMVKDMMNQTRSGVITQMSGQMPLIDQVMGKMQPMMKNKIMNTQMGALKNPNGGIPGSIAPPMF
jgi:hypothetical protein